MSKKIIPQRLEVTCDSCRNICTKDPSYPGLSLQAGRIEISSEGVTFGGYDLCDSCLTRIRSTMDGEIEKIRKENEELATKNMRSMSAFHRLQDGK